MNLVAARAANMLAILPEANAVREDKTDLPTSPFYQCGKEHSIPGAVALNAKKPSQPPRTLPPLAKQKYVLSRNDFISLRELYIFTIS